jgi:hypothetical protein
MIITTITETQETTIVLACYGNEEIRSGENVRWESSWKQPSGKRK